MEVKLRVRNIILNIFLLVFLVVGIFVTKSYDKYNSIFAYIFIYFISIYIFFSIGKSEILSLPTMFCVFFSVMIALGPIVAIYRGYKLHPQIYYLILLAFIFYILGYLMPQRKKKDNSKSVINENNYYTIWVCSIILLIISIGAICLYILKNRYLLFGGNLEDGRVSALSGNGYLIYLGNMWSLASCILYELHLKGYKKIKKLKYLIAFAVLLKLFTGYRSPVVSFGLILLYMKNKKKKFNPLTVICIGIVGIILVCGYQVFRNYMSGGTSFHILDSILNLPYVGVINLDYIINYFPEIVDFQYGYSYLINFIMLKPGPDLDFTLWLKSLLNLQFSGGGVTPTIIGEFFLNFSCFGTAAGMFFLGMITKKINMYYEDSSAIYLSSMFSITLLSTIREGIANIEISLTINLIIYFFLIRISRKFNLRNSRGKL